MQSCNGVDDRRTIPYGRALGNTLIALGRYDEARDALKIAARAAERLIARDIYSNSLALLRT